MKRLILVGIMALALPGCDWFTKSHPKQSEVWPVYAVPARPGLNIPSTIKPGMSPELDSMITSTYKLTQHIESLELLVETHNAAAKAHNKKVEQDLGVGGAR